MDELKKVYEDKLILALFYTRNYNMFISINGVNNIILKKEFIIKFTTKVIDMFSNSEILLSDECCRNNILTTINNLRFNYNYKDDVEKEELYNLFNQCIIIMNNVYFEDNYFQIELKKVQELQKEEEFYFVHYYLQNNDFFLKEGVPFFCLADYYLVSLATFINEYPSLLEDLEFLRRTKLVLETSLSDEAKKQYPDDYENNAKDFKKVYNIFFK